MRIRLRGPEGASTMSLADDATVAALRAEITKSVGGPFDLKYSFPPKPLDLDQWSDDLKLSDTGVKLDGEQLIANPRDIAASLSHAVRSPPQPAPAPVSTHRLGNRTERTAAIPPASTSIPAALPPPNSDDPPEIPVPTLQATCILRVMPDDNSCLFRAISSALMSDLDSTVAELRSVVATQIQADPAYYTTAVLERPPDAYCRWIQQPTSWGGAIELAILAQHFDVEIASVNVQDLRVDRFNEGRPSRCILVYSGIHYDVIALSPSDPPHTRADLPAELDIKVFGGVESAAAMAAALELCKELQRRHYYTDTAGFAIVCGDCGWKGNGEAAAQKHCKATGHYNFSESS